MADGSQAARSLDEARERLKQRKKRRTTSCWPCRDRKVKCDKSRPCDTCLKRGHADLCTYERVLGNQFPAVTALENSNGVQNSPASGGSVAGGGRGSVTGHPVEDFVTVSSRDTLQNSSTSPKGDRPEPFLGQNSIPHFVRDQTSAEDATGRRSHIEGGIMPILGLQDSPSDYPFLPIANENSSIHEALPSDREIIRLFQCYRTQLHAFTPILCDVDSFETQICSYIEFRAEQKRPGGGYHKSSFSPGWVSLLYAVLASGAQFSDLAHDQRSSMSQKFTRYSAQSLRLANFLLRPSIECVQTFLLLGNVMQNAMKPEAAWIMLGTTTRLAQSLGLHQLTAGPGAMSTGRKLWLAIVWQDCLLSLCFDRPAATATSTIPQDLNILGSSNLSYADAMYALVVCSLKGINLGSSDHGFEIMKAITRDIDQIYSKVEVHLQKPEACSNIQQKCEHYALRLHTNFVEAWFARVAFRSRPCPENLQQMRQELIIKGKNCLLDSLKAYLQLQPLCVLASRSWAFIHNGLSSALLLGLIGETRVNPEVRKLQGDLIDTLSTGDDGNRTIDTEGNVVLSKLHSRALAALKNLYNDQSHSVLATTSAPYIPQQYQTSTNNRTMSHDTNYMPTTQQPAYPSTSAYNVPNSAYNQQSLDAITGMSPMQMFDSIIWDPNFSNDAFPELDTLQEPWMVY